MGIVYLIKDISNLTYKIGVTKNDANIRMKKLQTGNSTELKVDTIFETEYPFRLETMLHNRYKQFQILNEWYDLPKSEVDKFTSVCTELNNVIISLKDNPFFKKGLK